MSYKALKPIQTKIVARAAEVVDGGVDYRVEDGLRIIGGTGLAATLTVSSISSIVSSGVVTAVKVEQGGAYSICPANPVSVAGGAGSGAKLNILWKGRRLDIGPGEVLPEDCEYPNAEAWMRLGLLTPIPGSNLKGEQKSKKSAKK